MRLVWLHKAREFPVDLLLQRRLRRMAIIMVEAKAIIGYYSIRRPRQYCSGHWPTDKKHVEFMHRALAE